MKKNLIFAVFLCFSINTVAQNVVLDVSFGNNTGKVLTAFDNLSAGIGLLLRQTDSKIIALGSVTNYSQNTYQIALARYNNNGQLDGSFGVDGKVVSDFSDVNVFLHSAILQSNGQILVGAEFYPLDSESGEPIKSVLILYNNDGNIDTTFGINGIVARDSFFAKSMVQQLNDEIFIAGTIYQGGVNYFSLLKYTANFMPDITFGNNGLLITPISELGTNIEMKIQSDGKLLVVSEYNHTSFSDYIVMRFNSNGSPDVSFGNQGSVVVGEPYGDWGATLTVQNDNKILISGITSSPPDFNQKYLIYRILPNGDLDSGFGVNGKVVYYMFPGIGVNKIEQLPDGKLLVLGYINNLESYKDVVLTRFLDNGILDDTFGNNGSLISATETSSSIGAILQLPDSKILLGGSAGTLTAGSASIPYKFMLQKYVLDSELSVDSISLFDKQLRVFPNPFSSKVQLDFTLKEPKLFTIDLYESSGRKIVNLVKNKFFHIGFNSESLDLVNLRKGFYFLVVTDDGKTSKTIKIIKK